jgi:hypothetical protein
VTKSYVLIKVSRGGRSLVGRTDVIGGCFAHSSVRVLGSSVPRILEEESDVLIREGGWTSE